MQLRNSQIIFVISLLLLNSCTEGPKQVTDKGDINIRAEKPKHPLHGISVAISDLNYRRNNLSMSKAKESISINRETALQGVNGIKTRIQEALSEEQGFFKSHNTVKMLGNIMSQEDVQVCVSMLRDTTTFILERKAQAERYDKQMSIYIRVLDNSEAIALKRLTGIFLSNSEMHLTCIGVQLKLVEWLQSNSDSVTYNRSKKTFKSEEARERYVHLMEAIIEVKKQLDANQQEFENVVQITKN